MRSMSSGQGLVSNGSVAVTAYRYDDPSAVIYLVGDLRHIGRADPISANAAVRWLI